MQLPQFCESFSVFVHVLTGGETPADVQRTVSVGQSHAPAMHTKPVQHGFDGEHPAPDPGHVMGAHSGPKPQFSPAQHG